MGILNFLFKRKSTKQIIIEKYYSDYPVIPYISEDRDEEWLEKAEFFKDQCIIPKRRMTPFKDGLLPGHVYMLHWIEKNKNKRIPAYFEYKYGIDFEKEKDFLCKNEYLDENSKLTEKGVKAIKKHQKVIIEHNGVKTERTLENIKKQINELKKNIRKNGFDMYTFHANSNCCETCASLNGKHFKIAEFKTGVNAPPMHEGCRCSISAYENEAAYESWLNSL